MHPERSIGLKTMNKKVLSTADVGKCEHPLSLLAEYVTFLDEIGIGFEMHLQQDGSIDTITATLIGRTYDLISRRLEYLNMEELETLSQQCAERMKFHTEEIRDVTFGLLASRLTRLSLMTMFNIQSQQTSPEDSYIKECKTDLAKVTLLQKLVETTITQKKAGSTAAE